MTVIFGWRSRFCMGNGFSSAWKFTVWMSIKLILLRTYDLTMQTRIKRYNILLRGNVQHIGYRGIIEGTARKLNIKGYVFNDVDGSVKIACEGLQKSIDAFINGLSEFARSDIDSIEKKEVHEELHLPSVFSRVATDDYYEFSEKFDIGIDFLDGIKIDTGEMKESLTNINTTLEAFVIKQDGHNQRMDEHNQRLENILVKLAEK
ncbi:MAG: acylphosphatase [ANME-2 cluster archaeon]|nr:acylphosphatase [ANME-2 cluster archaeon]MBC2701100.1 acylphosphatase [ANME-2 cluster archaeon]MBC2748386.1 acylphosphatase [ANME-2 cluster archaeon]